MAADVRPRGDTAVVLLHGQPGTAGDWHRVEPLLDERYRVIVVDRPGYGRTGGPATGFAGNAAAVGRLLDSLEVTSAIVVGHSWAGGITMAFAADLPERTAGVVLVSSVGPGEHLSWDDRLLAQPVLGELIAAVTIGGVGYLLGRSRIQRLAAQRLRGGPADAFVALTRLTAGTPGVWRSFVTEQRALRDELEQLATALPAITAPTVVVHGSGDRLVPLSVARANAGAIRGSRLRIVENAGHLLPHDHPAAIVAAIEEVGQTAR